MRSSPPEAKTQAAIVLLVPLPHLFRGQRTSVAVLDGGEGEAELKALGRDVFAHFGMGCRSVTKLWIPSDFNLDRCFAAWMDWGHLAQHGKYANNYDYHKAVWLLNREDLIENGFVLVKEERDGLVSPIGTLYVERYDILRFSLVPNSTPAPTSCRWSRFGQTGRRGTRWHRADLCVWCRAASTSIPSSTTTQMASTPSNFCCPSKGEGGRRHFAP